MIKRKLAYLGLLAIFWLVMHLYLFPATAILFYMLLVFLPILFLVFCVGTFRMKVVVEIPVQVVKKGELFCLRFRVKGRQRLLWYGFCIEIARRENGKRRSLYFRRTGRTDTNYMPSRNTVRSLHFP